MSTRIEAEFRSRPWAKEWHYVGVIVFYLLVLLVIFAGGVLSAHMHGHFYRRR